MIIQIRIVSSKFVTSSNGEVWAARLKIAFYCEDSRTCEGVNLNLFAVGYAL